MNKPDQHGICQESLFSQCFKRYAKPLRSYIFFKFGNADQADDVTQEAFIKLWENCANVPFEKCKSFLYTVANNTTLNQIAHQKVVLNFAKSAGTDGMDHINPEFIIEEQQFGVKLQAAIASLTEAQRTAFLMNRIESKKYHEIAEILGISVKAVEKRIHGALVSLRRDIEQIK